MSVPPIASSELWRALTSILEPHGFSARPGRRFFVRRQLTGVWHVVGLRTGRPSKLPEYAVYFGVWVPEIDGLRYDAAADQGRSLKHMGRTFELSPIAPLKNTFWWSADLADATERESLRRQLIQIALPFFDTFEQPAALLAAMHSWEESLGPDVVDSLRRRCSAEAGPPVTLSDGFTQKLASEMAVHGFQRAADRLWRLRGGVIDIVVVEPLADHRFVSLYVAVWHASLTSGIDGSIPDGVTMATAQQVGANGVNGGPVDGLFFTAKSASTSTPADEISLKRPIQAMLEHFASVNSREDVLAALPVEYRSHFSA